MKNVLKRILVTAGFSFFLVSCILAQAKTSVVSSPDGHLQFLVYTENDRIFFTVTFNNVQIVEKSLLRMMVNDYEITYGVAVGKVKRYSIDETFPWYGLHSQAKNKCNGLIISYKNRNTKTDFNLDIRVFNCQL
jgi:alpha-glucosidase